MTGTIRRTALAGVLLALACASGTGVRVETTTTPGTDFSKYRSFALVPPSDARPVVRDRLESEVRDALDGRGLRAAERGQSDVLVVMQTKDLPREREVLATPPAGCCVVQRYVEGTLVIEIFDARSSQMIWHGEGEVDLLKVSDRRLEKAASEAAQAVLAELPSDLSR